MELRHLRYFVAVAEALNFTRASALLRVAQPALSRQVRDLEDEIGVDLLTRSPRGVALTAEGKLFLDEARDILARCAAATEKARALARGEFGELNVGYSPSPTVELLPPALKAFQKSNPRVTVRLHDLGGNELAEQVRGGQLAFAVMQRPLGPNGAGLSFEALHAYPIRVAVSPDHALARLRAIPATRLAREKLVVLRRRDYADYHVLLSRVLSGLAERPAVAVECDGSNSLFTEVAAGRGVAIVTQAFAKVVGSRLRLRPLSPPPDPQEVGIVRATNGDVTPAGEKLCTVLRNIARALSKR